MLIFSLKILLRLLEYHYLLLLFFHILLENNYSIFLVISHSMYLLRLSYSYYYQMHHCKTWENSNFLKKGKTVISVKSRNFSRSWMMKRISPLESSCEI